MALACTSLCLGAAVEVGAEPRPAGSADDHVELSLRVLKPSPVIAFGLPLPRGRVKDVTSLRVSAGGRPVAARIEELLAEHDAGGARAGVRAAFIQLPAAPGLTKIEIAWPPRAAGPALAAPAAVAARRPFDDAARSWESPEIIATRARTLAPRGASGAALSEGPIQKRTLWIGREPTVLVDYPEGYLARTGLLGHQVSAREARRGPQKGISFLSTAAETYAGSAMYDLPYAVSSQPDAAPDPKTSFEAWLYDRCATYLLVYTHTGEERFLRHAGRTCSWYARQIRAQGPERGIFAGKPDADPKYSHARGLYAYYALTGDEAARDAVVAIADYWLNDRMIVTSYRQGALRPDRLWTERLLGTAFEGLYYGHRLTGDKKYLTAFTELLATAHRHITGDATALAQINPGASFPPQNCFVHSAQQHGEGDAQHPWCSGWMVELLLDPLLRYQEQTGDARVDEILIRLTRFLRDTGSTYFRNDPLDDTFLKPAVCDTSAADHDRRMLVPLYGAGLDARGKRVRQAEYSDFEHCVDASSLVAAGLRALRRRGAFDKGGPIGPFASEGESFVQLHQELAACAMRVFENAYRPKRAPAAWKPDELAAGRGDPAKFVADNKIGFPMYDVSPLRKLSWWLNSSLETWGLLSDAGVTEAQLKPGRVCGPAAMCKCKSK
ncbi:MAG TPA: hypothetical protein VN903_05610 [Polyangia bacterium]|nr:hypothetical protein [Polyangia bacterium]